MKFVVIAFLLVASIACETDSQICTNALKRNIPNFQKAYDSPKTISEVMTQVKETDLVLMLNNCGLHNMVEIPDLMEVKNSQRDCVGYMLDYFEALGRFSQYKGDNSPNAAVAKGHAKKNAITAATIAVGQYRRKPCPRDLETVKPIKINQKKALGRGRYGRKN